MSYEPNNTNRLFFFQGPIDHDIKTTVKNRNILFVTFSHTYQLHSQCSNIDFFVAWYQLSYILVIEASHLCFQPILYIGLQIIVPKCYPPTTVSYKERDENHREPSSGRWWWVIKHFPPFQGSLCCSCRVRPSTFMKKDSAWGQHSSSLFLNKGIELQHALHIWRETLLL